MSDESRFCIVCGSVMVPRANEKERDFQIRQCCGVPCANRRRNMIRYGLARVDIEPKRCLICEVLFARRKNELVSDFRRRRICGAERCRKMLGSRNAQNRWVTRKENAVAAKRPSSPPAASPMPVLPGMTAEDAIACFIKERGVTRCPTAAVASGSAVPPRDDAEALAARYRAIGEVTPDVKKWGWRG